MKHLLLLAVAGIALADEPAKCTPYEQTAETIPGKRIVNGKVEKCAPSGRWVPETGRAVFTMEDLIAAANSGHRQGAEQCVELLEKEVDRIKR